MHPQPRRASVRLPCDVVLTSRSLAAIGRKLATPEIGLLIDALIDELDARLGDPDYEPEIQEDEEIMVSIRHDAVKRPSKVRRALPQR